MRRSVALLWAAVLLCFRCCPAEDEVPEDPSAGRFRLHQGKEIVSEVVHTAAVGSAIQCALLCLRWPSCLAANFRPADGTGSDAGSDTGSAAGSGSCDLLGSQAGKRQVVAGAMALKLPGSCRHLQQLGYRTDGVYRHRGLPAPLYCDMTLNSGGWTLLVASVSTEGWTLDYVTERRRETPGIDINYSILGLGDQIKRLNGRSLFKYRLEVAGRQSWGGIWQAPSHYTLTGSFSNQTAGVGRVKTFDDWTPPTKNTPRDIVPWVNSRGAIHGYPLLTTCSELEEFWFGTLVTASYGDIFGVSPWIENRPELAQGARLYWIKED